MAVVSKQNLVLRLPPQTRSIHCRKSLALWYNYIITLTLKFVVLHKTCMLHVVPEWS